MTAGDGTNKALFLKIPRTKFLARMARLNRLSKRYRKEPQDISKRKRAILMPFHPPLNHDVYNHMEKIQPILSARFRVPPRSFFDSKSHSKLSARDGRRKDNKRDVAGNVLSVCDFLAAVAFDHHRNFYTTPARRLWSICLVFASMLLHALA